MADRLTLLVLRSFILGFPYNSVYIYIFIFFNLQSNNSSRVTSKHGTGSRGVLLFYQPRTLAARKLCVYLVL